MFSRKNHNDTNTHYGDSSNPNTTHSDPNASPHGTGSGNADSGRGPHKSSLLNKLDPRVDSTTGHQTSGTSRNDGGALGTNPRHENTGYGASDTGHGDTTGYGSAITGRNTGSTHAGPRNSNLANKMDPRVDSDMDRIPSRISRDSGYNTQHNSGYTDPSSNTGYGTSNTMSGPHSSNLANKADPRVDSDNSRGNHGNTLANYSSPTGNYGSNTTGTGYGNTRSTMTGPHSSNLANKADPRVDSDDSRGNYGNNSGTNYGTSHGESTNAGPHKSNLMNKLDPRVDSEMDGSRNTGMGQGIYQGMGNSNTGTMPQEISSHAHATGGPAGALEGKHAKHTSGNVSNATASAKVSGGMVPEGSADASGPLSADAGTTTSNQGGLKGAIKDLGMGSGMRGPDRSLGGRS